MDETVLPKKLSLILREQIVFSATGYYVEIWVECGWYSDVAEATILDFCELFPFENAI